MKSRVKAVLFCALLAATFPVSAAVKIAPPVKNTPKKTAWKPLTETEYQSFLRDPDFALADKNLRLIWRDAQRQLPLNRLEIIRKQQEEWEKSGRDREAEQYKNASYEHISGKSQRINSYLEATLVRCSWLWNKFGPFKVGGYDDANFSCGWADYERRVLYVEFNAGSPENYAVTVKGNRITVPDRYGDILFKSNSLIWIGNVNWVLKFETRDPLSYSTYSWPGASYRSRVDRGNFY